MSSTNKLKEKFFKKYIQRLIENKKYNIYLSPLKSEQLETFYITKDNDKKDQVFSISDFNAELKDLWIDNEELNDEELIKALIKLSEQLYEFEKETDEVSPFIYQMF